jgi:hypothetical protein
MSSSTPPDGWTGTEVPAGVIAIPAPELLQPLVRVWAAGLPSPAARRIYDATAGTIAPSC